MREFENDNWNPEEERPPEGEAKPETETSEAEVPASESPEESPETEAPEAAVPEKPEEAQEPPRREEEPYRDIYGNPHMSYQPPEPKKPQKQGVNMSGGVLALLLVCCMLVSILAGAGINYMFDGGFAPAPTASTTDPTETTDSQSASGSGSAETTAGETAPSISVNGGSSVGNTDFPDYERYAAVANECIQSVVIIRVTETVTSYGQQYESSGAGSGVIYTEDGYIVTNYHVASESSKTIEVELYDGTTYPAKYIYGDKYVDLAVVKIEKNDCVPAKIGDSSKMALGQMVVAIGNPLGYGLTVTDGLVSALSRSVTIEDTTMTLMQTSAAINSGNSGGGLFNLNGELIGIVNAKVGGTSVEAMGYAIPSATVIKSLNDLKEYGYITGKARLGVTVQTKQYQSWHYLQVYQYIQVVEISENGSAAASGLQVGDILYKFNDKEITSFEVLSEQLTRYSVGDTVTLTVRRPTIELTNENLLEYLNTCQELTITVTFVEFNPNA